MGGSNSTYVQRLAFERFQNVVKRSSKWGKRDTALSMVVNVQAMELVARMKLVEPDVFDGPSNFDIMKGPAYYDCRVVGLPVVMCGVSSNPDKGRVTITTAEMDSIVELFATAGHEVLNACYVLYPLLCWYVYSRFLSSSFLR